MKKTAFISIVATALFACASPSMSMDDYLAQYQGWSRNDLESVWGQPDQVIDNDTDVTLQFQTSRKTPVMVSPAIYQPYYDGKTTQQRIVQPERWATVEQHCKTTFTLNDDAVVFSYYQGDGCVASAMPSVTGTPSAE